MKPISHLYNTQSAAKFLQSQLGGSELDHFQTLVFYQSEVEPPIPFLNTESGMLYEESGLCRYVAEMREAECIGSSKITLPLEDSGAAKADLDIDYLNGNQLCVFVKLPNDADGRKSKLSPQEALRLASELIEVAKFCQTHYPSDALEARCELFESYFYIDRDEIDLESLIANLEGSLVKEVV